MKKLIIGVFIFFTPIVLINTAIELYVRDLPFTIKNRAEYFEKNKENIEILILGGSQNRDAMNVEVMEKPSFNIGTSSQGYYINSKFLKSLAPQLPKLKTVVIPMTYKHFEMAPPQYNSWRNNAYRYYFDLEIDDKFTYFKDKLLFLSNPKIYNSILKNFHNRDTTNPENALYNYDIRSSLFYKLEFDKNKIANYDFKIIPKKQNLQYLIAHKKYLDEMLAYCENQNINIVFSMTPVTNEYLQKQNPIIKRHVDSILSKSLVDYGAKLFCPEIDEFSLFKDFRDHTHLSPSGAAKYSKQIETFINHLE